MSDPVPCATCNEPVDPDTAEPDGEGGHLCPQCVEAKAFTDAGLGTEP